MSPFVEIGSFHTMTSQNAVTFWGGLGAVEEAKGGRGMYIERKRKERKKGGKEVGRGVDKKKRGREEEKIEGGRQGRGRGERGREGVREGEKRKREGGK